MRREVTVEFSRSLSSARLVPQCLRSPGASSQPPAMAFGCLLRYVSSKSRVSDYLMFRLPFNTADFN